MPKRFMALIMRKDSKLVLTNRRKVIIDGIRQFRKWEKAGTLRNCLQKLNLDNVTLYLDIGCGFGLPVLNYFKAVNVNIFVGIDNSETRIRLANLFAIKLGMEANKRFIIAKAEELPFSDKTFDLITIELVLPYTDNKRAIREISRVLTDRGIAVFRLHSFAYYIHALPESRGIKETIYFVLCIMNSLYYFCTGIQIFPKMFGRGAVAQSVGRFKVLLKKHGLMMDSNFYPEDKLRPIVIVRKCVTHISAS